jgi:hypothetical protein
MIIIRDVLAEQLSTLVKTEQKQKYLTALIGSLNISTNDIEVISAIHLPISSAIVNDKLSQGIVTQLLALQYMLPYQLEIVGLAVYDTAPETIDFSELIKEQKLNKIIFIAKVTEEDISCFRLTETTKSLKHNVATIPIHNQLSFVHTMEFETSEENLKDLVAFRQTMYDGLHELWDKITFSKDQNITVSELLASKSPIDRIIEVIIPCEEKDIAQQSASGQRFLAFDLHMNVYPTKDNIKQKLVDLKDILNKALTRDLLVKLQRAVIDTEKVQILAPRKIPINYDKIQLTAYSSKDKQSKNEYEICSNLIKHAEVLGSIGYALTARILLRDLRNYFLELKDEEKVKQIDSLVLELSAKG